MKVEGLIIVSLQTILSLSAAIFLNHEYGTYVNVSMSQRRYSMLKAEEQASYAVDETSSTTKNSIRKAQVKNQGLRTPGTPCTNLRRRQQYGQTNRPIYFEQPADARVVINVVQQQTEPLTSFFLHLSYSVPNCRYCQASVLPDNKPHSQTPQP
jgi:hypothetical protein